MAKARTFHPPLRVVPPIPMKTGLLLMVLTLFLSCTTNQHDRLDGSYLNSNQDYVYRPDSLLLPSSLPQRGASVVPGARAVVKTTERLNVSGIMNLQPDVVSGFASHLGYEDHVRMVDQMMKEYQALPKSSRAERALSNIERVLHDYIEARYSPEDPYQSAVPTAVTPSRFINIPSDSFVEGLFSLLNERPLLGFAAIWGVVFFFGLALYLLIGLLDIMIHWIRHFFRTDRDNIEASTAIHPLNTATQQATVMDRVEEQFSLNRDPAESRGFHTPNDLYPPTRLPG